MEPAVGFEPTTDGLQNRSSTTELSWHMIRYGNMPQNREKSTAGASRMPFFLQYFSRYNLKRQALRRAVLRKTHRTGMICPENNTDPEARPMAASSLLQFFGSLKNFMMFFLRMTVSFPAGLLPFPFCRNEKKRRDLSAGYFSASSRAALRQAATGQGSPDWDSNSTWRCRYDFRWRS